jgi:hypothetical protein
VSPISRGGTQAARAGEAAAKVAAQWADGAGLFLLQRLAHDPLPEPEVLCDWLPDRWRPPAAEAPGQS